MPDGPAGLEVVPVLSYPRQAEAGRTYLMTVDLRPSGAASWGAGPAEEVLFRCVLNAYPLFRCEAVGDPSLVCHRFGGTYGPARFLLTAADAEVEGTLRLTLANEWGVPVALYESDPIQVRKAADAAPEPSGLRVVRHEAAPAAGPDTSAAREPALPPTEAGAPGWIAAAAYLKKLFPGRPPLEGELHDAVHGLLRGVGAHLSPPVYYVALHEGWRVGGLVSEDPEQASAERTRTFVPTHGVVEVRPFDEPLLEYALGSSATRLWRDYGKVLLTNGWEFLLLGQDADGQPAVVEHFRLGERPPTRRLPGGAARAAKASELAGFLARVMEPPTPRNLRDHAIVIDARSTLSPGTGRAAAEDLRLFQEWLVDPLGGGLPPANVTVLSESVLSNEGARTLSAFLAGRLDIAGPGRRMYLYLRGGADGISRPEVLYLPQPGQRPHASVARDDLVKGLQARNAFDEWVVLLHCERTWSQLVQPAPIPAWTSPEQAPYPTLFAAEWLDTSSAGGQATRDLVSALDGGLVPGPELANRLRSSPDLSTLRREGPTIVQQGLPDAVMMLGSVGPTSRARVLVRGIDRGSRLIVQRGDDVEVRTGVETFIYLSLAHGRYTLRRQSGQLEIPLEIRGAGVMEVDLPTEPERAEGSRYNFTDEVRRVLTLAREESIRLQHDYVGTEHILLGLLRSPECAGAVLLRRMGLDPGDLRAVVEGSVRRGKATIALGELPYTSRAKKVLEFAMAEQRLAGDEANCTDHLLLGLIREEKGIAAEVLAMRGATLERALVEEVRGRDEIAAARAGETRDEPVQQVRQVRPQPLPLKPPQPVRPRLGRFARESRGPAGGPYNFTDRVRKSLAMAREEAIRLQHDYVGTEHILLGLLRDGEGVGAAVLYVLDVDFDQLFTAAEDSIRRGKAILPLGELPYTSRAKKVL
ncbi:MAG TPA: Clp protease N-terminal domain-containing protein, partial [Longimicrobium sp.]|nr:Clp protease N-terminal domain-containing protein [Longimicrobium sp.]